MTASNTDPRPLPAVQEVQRFQGSVCLGKRCIGLEAEDEIRPHVHTANGVYFVDTPPAGGDSDEAR